MGIRNTNLAVNMRILGIETSCDETAVAVVDDGTKVISSVIASTKDIFSDAGGVVPEDAARRQVEMMLPVLHKALEDAECSMQSIDAIAVTKGPGLMGSLLTGTTTARVLASLHKKPLIGVHHTFGHLTSTWLLPSPTPNTNPQPPSFPCITLSVSGGHSDLWLRKAHTDGERIGTTRDDAAGEAFDKGASMLSLPYPGGPSISKEAENGNEQAIELPAALKGEDTCDFSFSGLKTALKYTIRDHPEMSTEDLAASYQYAICKQLTDRVMRACKRHPEVREVHIVGGVSANRRLRSMIEEQLGDVVLRVPSTMQYCTDNAAMIAAGAYFLVKELGDAAFAEFETAATISL